MVDEKECSWTQWKYKLFFWMLYSGIETIRSRKGYISRVLHSSTVNLGKGTCSKISSSLGVSLMQSGEIPRKLECLLIAHGES